MNSMEDLSLDKENYSHVLVFYMGYFIKEMENISPPVFPCIRYRNTRGSLGELEIVSVETLASRARVPTSISRSPKLL